MPSELWQLSAVEQAEGIRQKQFSCLELMTSVVERVRAENPKLNAIVYDYSEEALDQARAADAQVAAGAGLGSLHGVPVTIKENVDVRGKPTPNGMVALEKVIAPDDAPLVANLRKAGAIVVGRTNTPELSMRFTTDNVLHGRTVNPWNAEASPGGSSGGAGAAAAAGFGPIHHGNDIGGSLRMPAFACGVATVKPTPGRIPAWNPSSTAERGMLAQLMSVQGAICREVRDVRLATEVMAARDPRDPWWVPVPFYGETLPKRMAFTKNAHGYPMHPEVGEALERVVGWLQEDGYEVVEAEPPSVYEPAMAWFSAEIAEMREMLTPLAKQHGSQDIQNVLEWYSQIGKEIDPLGYMFAIADRTRMTRAWSVFLDQYPLLLTPFMMRPTFPWNYDAQGLEQTQDLIHSLVYSVGINYVGLPAGVVPVGMMDGLPFGLQVVGRRFREDLILDALEAIEARVGIMAHQLWAKG